MSTRILVTILLVCSYILAHGPCDMVFFDERQADKVRPWKLIFSISFLWTSRVRFCVENLFLSNKRFRLFLNFWIFFLNFYFTNIYESKSVNKYWCHIIWDIYETHSVTKYTDARGRYTHPSVTRKCVKYIVFYGSETKLETLNTVQSKTLSPHKRIVVQIWLGGLLLLMICTPSILMCCVI